MSDKITIILITLFVAGLVFVSLIEQKNSYEAHVYLTELKNSNEISTESRDFVISIRYVIQEEQGSQNYMFRLLNPCTLFLFAVGLVMWKVIANTKDKEWIDEG